MKKGETSHVRLAPDQVRFLFESGHLRPSGYLFLLLSSLKQHGWVHRIEKVDDFCQEWGLSRSAFYRAKAKLIEQDLLDEKIIGAVDVKTRNVPSSFSVPPGGDGVPLTEDPVPLNETKIPLSGTENALSETPVPDLRKSMPETSTGIDFQAPLNSSSDLYSNKEQTLYSSNTDNFSFKGGLSGPEKIEAMFKNQGKLHPWQITSRRRDFDKGFIAFLVEKYLPSTPSFKETPPERWQAEDWLARAEFSPERLDISLAQWQRFKAEAESPEAINKGLVEQINRLKLNGVIVAGFNVPSGARVISDLTFQEQAEYLIFLRGLQPDYAAA
jgi:hypothetical protein